jgi:SAM-dependent methyltransferase
MTRSTGTAGTREFYETTGWKTQGGQSVDAVLFGVKEDGPVRIELHRLHQERIVAALSRAGTPLNVLECGCGGSPERLLVSLASRYTGVDFSDLGLARAREEFADVAIDTHFEQVDICSLPFEDGSFDAVYSGHVVYHIHDPVAQAAAIAEMVRVVRPGGVVAIVAANPRPLLFPVRLTMRMIADAPVVSDLLNRLRPAPPVPYRPMPIGWMKSQLQGAGRVEATTCALPSTFFNHRVSEYSRLGKRAWHTIRWLDKNLPEPSAYLGNYVLFTVQKNAA